jgi:hypothetical protein
VQNSEKYKKAPALVDLIVRGWDRMARYSSTRTKFMELRTTA